jgi:hypothetical protein
MAKRSALRVCIAAVLSAGTLACGPSAEVQRQLDEVTAISAEKDSLLLQVAENARLMSDISSEVLRVRAPAGTSAESEAPARVDPERIMADIRLLTQRILESEERLAQSQDRIQTLTNENSRLSGAVRNIEVAAQQLQASITSQRETISTLTYEVDVLRRENTRLADENTSLTEEAQVLAAQTVALADTVAHMTELSNTVYYVIGTREDLRARGIIEEEGGSRVLLVFGRRGTTLVPARGLDTSHFIPADRRKLEEITLPDPERAYRIASRQDVSALETPPDEDGDIRGSLRIADPDRFWANSRFLILVER